MITIIVFSFCASATLLLSYVFFVRHTMLPMTRLHDLAAVQSSNARHHYRFGGIILFISLGLTVVFLSLIVGDTASKVIAFMLISAVPVFVAGMLEDIGTNVSAKRRLLAAILSSIFAMILFQAWATRLDFPSGNLLLSHPFIAILLTIVFAAFFCHTLNIIDGMNGLASFVTLTSSLGLGAVAYNVGHATELTVALIFAASSFGFILFNWPIANIFLGDSGSYLFGHLIGWLSILILSLSDEVAVPALALITFWPLADVMHTVARRIEKRANVMKADKMHMHQKIRRSLDIIFFGYRRHHISNSLTTFLLLPFISAPVLTGVLLWDSASAAWLMFAVYLLLFFVAHPLVIVVAKKLRRLKNVRFMKIRVRL